MLLKPNKNILFIVQYPQGIGPSQRFRIELYADILRQHNIHFTTESFIDNNTRKILYQRGYTFKKIGGVLKGFFRRIAGLLTISKYDFVFIQREAAPMGPPVFEWLYAKVFNKKIIYDFDDALWIPVKSYNNERGKFFKCFWKIKFICKWSYKISAGNMILYNYAFRYNKNMILNPTCVDTDEQHNIVKDQHTNEIKIGWTGSFSTLPYLNVITQVINELEKKYDFEFIVIADKDSQLPLKSFKFKPWNKENEINDLLACNIGIMPLIDNDFSQGKCGFKIIQFLALGIPVVASSVGVNKNIIENNTNGFLCTSKEEWITALEKLIKDASIREQMGKAGREKIIKHYSIYSNADNFISLFQ